MSPYEPIPSPDETTIFPYHDLTPPTPGDVYRAKRRIASYLPTTPLVRSEWLSEELDADVYLKREDTLPTGAFKVRGGINLVSGLDEEFKQPGLIAASTGNHGQSIAYAGRLFDVPVVICVPDGANPAKVAAMERLGATVEHHGSIYDEARGYAEERATAEGYRYVHSANEPDLVAGVGTAGLEVIESCPGVDTVICPVGGGSSASGYCLTAGSILDAQVIGVQSAAAPAMHRAWSEDSLEPHERMDTFAEGLASRVPFALTTQIMRERLDEFTLVSDADIRMAIRRLLKEERIVAEGAGAAGTAGALELGEGLAGQSVVVVVSGRNIAPQKLRRIIES